MSQLVTKGVDSSLPRVCKGIKVTLLKVKSWFNCINDLIKIAPFPQGYFDCFFSSLYSETIWLQRLNFLCITVNVCDGSEPETINARYVGVNKLIREILIEIALSRHQSLVNLNLTLVSSLQTLFKMCLIDRKKGKAIWFSFGTVEDIVNSIFAG